MKILIVLGDLEDKIINLSLIKCRNLRNSSLTSITRQRIFYFTFLCDYI
jgi:hypothetical protein